MTYGAGACPDLCKTPSVYSLSNQHIIPPNFIHLYFILNDYRYSIINYFKWLNINHIIIWTHPNPSLLRKEGQKRISPFFCLQEKGVGGMSTRIINAFLRLLLLIPDTHFILFLIWTLNYAIKSGNIWFWFSDKIRILWKHHQK